jgi:hypothetical protein
MKKKLLKMGILSVFLVLLLSTGCSDPAEASQYTDEVARAIEEAGSNICVFLVALAICVLIS